MTRPGWYPDPSGRFPRRWFDGSDWTASVLDLEQQQSYDLLPPGGPPKVGLPPAPVVHPDSRLPAPDARPMGIPTPPAWEPAPPPLGQAIPPPRPALPPTQRHDSSAGFAWPAAPTPTSLGPMSGPTTGATRRRLDPVAMISSTAGSVMIALSLFVLDWAPSGSFADLRSVLSDADGLGWPDTVVKLYTQWLGYAWLVATGLTVSLATGGRIVAARFAHVGAAALAGTGAVLAAFVVVRTFVGPGPGPEVGAWLLVAGYMAMLAAIVVSARRV